MNREQIRDAARSIVALYNSTMKIENKASVRKGKKEHLDPTLEPTKGHWVDCKVFIPEDWGSE